MIFHAYLVRIPRMDLHGAIKLGRTLVAATNMVLALPEPIIQARNTLAKCLDKLTATMVPRYSVPAIARSPVAEAGRRLDSAWFACLLWLHALSALPADNPTGRSAAEVLAGVFPGGVALVRAPPLCVLAESETRLERIERGGFESTMRSFGGGPFLETIREAHAACARQLDDSNSAVLSSRARRRGLDAFVLAVHAYVSSVIAELATGDNSEWAALAAVLLAPIEYADATMDAHASFFDRTVEACPPPPPDATDFDELAWPECAS